MDFTRRVCFPSENYGEGTAWARRLHPPMNAENERNNDRPRRRRPVPYKRDTFVIRPT